jgi:tRNA uridine 5-carbamoylmethylation protein Kti12
MRQQLVDLFTTYDAYVKIVYIEKPYKIWLEQNTNREFPIPQTVLEKMLGKLEIPQVWEAQEVAFLVT